MVTYRLSIPYESGSNSYTATFNVYKYDSVGTFVASTGYRVPNPEHLFLLEPLLHGKPLDEHMTNLVLTEIQDSHRRPITKIMGYQLIITHT